MPAYWLKWVKVNETLESGLLTWSMLVWWYIVYVQLCDLRAVEYAHSHQVVKQALVENQVPEQSNIEVLNPTHLKHIGSLWHIDHILSAWYGYYQLYLDRVAQRVVRGCILHTLCKVVSSWFVARRDILTNQRVSTQVLKLVEEIFFVGIQNTTSDTTMNRCSLLQSQSAIESYLWCTDWHTLRWNENLSNCQSLHLHRHCLICFVVKGKDDICLFKF